MPPMSRAGASRANIRNGRRVASGRDTLLVSGDADRRTADVHTRPHRSAVRIGEHDGVVVPIGHPHPIRRRTELGRTGVWAWNP